MVVEKSLTINFTKKGTEGRTEGMDGRKDGQTDVNHYTPPPPPLFQSQGIIKESWVSIPKYNLLLFFCIPNMNFLSNIVVEISLTKNVERKKKDICKKE